MTTYHNISLHYYYYIIIIIILAILCSLTGDWLKFTISSYYCEVSVCLCVVCEVIVFILVLKLHTLEAVGSF